jgi:hypothetical protein
MPMNLSSFISRWSASSGAERANKDSFLNELCDVLGVPRPDPTRGIAEYKLLESLPEPLQTSLPSIEQIERELQGIES